MKTQRNVAIAFVVVAIPIALILLLSGQPSFQKWLIRERISRNIGEPPLASHVYAAVQPRDNPGLVLAALWELATSDESTDREQAAAQLTITMMVTGRLKMRADSVFSETQWDAALQRFLLDMRDRRHSLRENEHAYLEFLEGELELISRSKQSE